MAGERQGRGIAARGVMELESVFNTVPAVGSRNALEMFFNTLELSASRTKQQSAEINGDRNPSRPFDGFIDVAGSLTMRIDNWLIGYFLKMGVGSPVTTDNAGTGQSVFTACNLTTVASGTATFDGAGLTAAAADDRVIMASGENFFLITKTTANEWTISYDLADSATPADRATVSQAVAEVVTNEVSATAGTVTIASNVATFSDAQADLAVDQMLIYDVTGDPDINGILSKRCRVVTVTSTTVCTVETLDGFDVTDDAGVTVDALEEDPWFTHVFKIGATEDLPSAVIEKFFQDTNGRIAHRYSGCKVGQLEFMSGGDGELLMTAQITGAGKSTEYLAYDQLTIMNGDPDVTIAAGVATFTIAQTSAAVTNWFAYQEINGADDAATALSRPVRWAQLTVETSDTVWTVKDPFGGTPPNITAANVLHVTTATHSAISKRTQDFGQFDATLKEGGVATTLLESLKFTTGNNLDGSAYPAGQETRRELPEAIAAVTIELVAFFVNNDIVAKAENKVPTSFQILWARNDVSLQVDVSQAEIELKDVPVNTQGGLKANLNAIGYADANNTDESAIKFTLITHHGKY